MKRMTMIIGLLLVGISLTTSLYTMLTGVEEASAIEVPDAVVDVDDLNMRSGPGLRYSVLGKYPEGTPLEIIGQGRDSDGMPWLYVRTPNGKKGWMSARPNLRTTPYIQINMPLSDIPFVNAPTPTPVRADGEVAVDDLNMRSGPGLQHQKIGKYPDGTPFDIIGQSPDRDDMPWLYVQTPDGKKGWFSARPSLRKTPYMHIYIPHSQIPPRIELEEVEMDTLVYGNGVYRTAALHLSDLTTVSCQNVCRPFPIAQSFETGDVVCLEWYEFGKAEKNDKIGFDIRFNGISLGTKFLPAKGEKLCRAIRMRMPASGRYRALATVKKTPHQPPHEWTVD